MDASEKAKQWIEQGKDPRSAHWQAGLENLLDVFRPYLEPGRLIPVAPLTKEEIPVFNDALEFVDLPPDINAAFFPPNIAGNIVPPESAPELHRIDKKKQSYKILLERQGKEKRIATVEISRHAERPGVDLFQSGALLGSYEYENSEDCLASLAQVIRAHLWKKEKWSREDYKRYAVNWFERVIDLNKSTVAVHQDYSFFHTPSLVKSDRIDAIFTLIHETFLQRVQEPAGPLKEMIFSIREVTESDARNTQFNEYAEKIMLQFLNVIKDLELIDFKSFTEKENKQFNQEYARTVKKFANEMASVE